MWARHLWLLRLHYLSASARVQGNRSLFAGESVPDRFDLPAIEPNDSSDSYSCGLSESCSDLRWSTSSLSSSTSEKLELEDLGVRSVPGEGDSLFPEVQANVSNKDDQTALVLTLRTWVIGLAFCAVIAAFNCFCRMRYPSPIVTPVVTLILSYPAGCLLAHVLPRCSVPVPSPLVRLGLPAYLSLNPGPFSIKEHSLVLVMANVSTGPAFALDYLLVGSKFYGHTYSFGFSILLVLSSQLLSFGAAGLSHRVIVQPSSMAWPQNLPYCALLDALHRRDKEESARSSRFRFFAWVTVGAFAWYWLPGATTRIVRVICLRHADPIDGQVISSLLFQRSPGPVG